ncbi:hypothetical protein [Lentilactobacillus buchneri]|uniref:hypothetical protein n=1 Tax=Lentilactobacillus buchneri TaxID=1581 RepID=UPI001CDD7153|nr:hypothetical protein [Lentilactobacillus buchneri]
MYSKDSKNRKMAYSAELASLTVSALFTEIEKLGKALNDNIYVHADGDTKQYMNNYWKELNKIALNRPDADNNPIIFKYVKHIDTRVCLETISAKSKLKQYKWFVEKHALVYHIASQSADNSSID